ncbi:MAG: tetratricopeptide repeat protein [Stappiaceae bacterium]
MKPVDLFGYELSVSTDEAIESWNKTVLAFLAHAAVTPDHLQASMTKAEKFPMAHIAKGYFCILLGRKELVATAREAFAVAETQVAEIGITKREQLYLDALKHLLSGRYATAANTLHSILTDCPGDGLAAKLVHAIRFILGDAAGMRASLEQILDSYSDDNPATGYMYGCYAFALEETGEYERAEKMGRTALDTVSDDAWGLHAVAHVYDMTGRAEEGVEWMRARPDAWSHCNNFRYHCWWHLALMHLDRGEIDEVLTLYDNEVRQDKTDDYRDISNGASLLSRLEIDGVNVGNRWEELAALSEKRTADNCVVFADLHYMLSLNGGNRQEAANRLMTNVVTLAEQQDTDMGQVASEAGIPAMNGLEAYREGNYFSAYKNLSAALPVLKNVGGSHAQRDVFDRLTIEAAIRSGHAKDANELLNDRLSRRGGIDGYAARRFELVEKMLKASELMQDKQRFAIVS